VSPIQFFAGSTSQESSTFDVARALVSDRSGVELCIKSYYFTVKNLLARSRISVEDITEQGIKIILNSCTIDSLCIKIYYVFGGKLRQYQLCQLGCGMLKALT